MGHSILVPYDGSQHSQSALRYAADVFDGETITALHILDPFATIPDSEKQARERYERAQDVLETVPAVADDRSTTISSEFVYGHAIHAILRHVDLYTIDRIVIDGSYRADMADDSLGNVPETLVRRTRAPVTVLRSAVDDGRNASLETVLVPFDGSSPACNALQHAIDAFPEATVYVLYVRYPFVDDLDHVGVRSGDYPDFEEWYNAVRTWHERADRNADRVLGIADSIAGDSDADLRSTTETGPPSRVILKYADRIEADHVLVGSHSHDGGTRILLGSVAEQIVRRSSAPVTVVR
ncbi:UspA domain protein (plasmid) [Haloterrigena turkmenica DSM 5511]|uniref:UspA domain protein n=1 Tax=Haloterrigena turkmenica (strain ATCC 51198 / DSM 5511 / JCM 9101 / NCIMB 13204 / VKM B-1734 / 4k) TaxID=543526 RepID=D2S124_HALTV|nr:universal stress protein [Haloterrigena turkmenica]ADB63071.1 UspA domain protein [Haloterrigena turkmenica DSM 5511]